jgi:hypothetical protein
MKLYTEEQVNRLKYWKNNAEEDYLTTPISVLKYISELEKLTLIEIPSDEDIKSYSDRYSTMHEDVSDKLGKYLVSAIHIDGAKWMKEHIFNQNK